MVLERAAREDVVCRSDDDATAGRSPRLSAASSIDLFRPVKRAHAVDAVDRCIGGETAEALSGTVTDDTLADRRTDGRVR